MKQLVVLGLVFIVSHTTSIDAMKEYKFEFSICSAIARDDSPSIRLFLEAKALWNLRADLDRICVLCFHTPLTLAAEQGRVEIVQLLVKNEVDVDRVGKHKLAPLVYAICCDNDNASRAMVNILLQAGVALPKKKNNYDKLFNSEKCKKINEIFGLLTYNYDLYKRTVILPTNKYERDGVLNYTIKDEVFPYSCNGDMALQVYQSYFFLNDVDGLRKFGDLYHSFRHKKYS